MNKCPDGMSAVLCVVAFQTFKKNVRFADTSQAREEGVDARILRARAHTSPRGRASRHLDVRERVRPARASPLLRAPTVSYRA